MLRVSLGDGVLPALNVRVEVANVSLVIDIVILLDKNCSDMCDKILNLCN